MNHGSLFTGFGGFDIPAEWMGWNNVFHCEKDEFCQHILKYYWPNAKSYADIRKTDFTVHRGSIDILTGGFPCQPYSEAGLRKGTEDPRHLWPEMLRAIRECRPTWVLGENVIGIVSWNKGLVFQQVQVDLENEGYEVQPFVLPAAGVGAPHRRDRVWFIAYSADARIENERRRAVTSDQNSIASYASGNGQQSRRSGESGQTKGKSKGEGDQWKRIWSDNWGIGKQGLPTDPNEQRLEGSEERGQQSRNASTERFGTKTDADSNSDGFQGTRRTRRGRKGSKNNDFPISPDQNEFNEDISGLRTGKVREHGSPASQVFGHTGSDSNSTGQQEHNASGFSDRQRHDTRIPSTDWIQWPTVSPVCGRNDGFSDLVDFDAILKHFGREPAIKFTKWRNETIKGYGNAVVPEVPYQIYKVIEQMMKLTA